MILREKREKAGRGKEARKTKINELINEKTNEQNVSNWQSHVKCMRVIFLFFQLFIKLELISQ